MRITAQTAEREWMVIPMYDKLVNLLRNIANSDGNIKSNYIGLALLQAADAIEELEKQLREEKVDNINLTGWLAEEHAKHLWIPVTERLPEYMENVLVTDGVFSGMGWRDYYDCHGTKPKEDCWISPNTNVNDLGITHWMPLPEPPKEG